MEPAPATTATSAVSATRPIRVVVAEASYLIREFLAETLARTPEIELTALCRNGTELQAAISIWRPEVIVIDIRMPPGIDLEGMRIAARMHAADPQVGVVVLSQYAEPAYAMALLYSGSGRRAYLLKERIRDRHELIGAIETVAAGGSVIDPTIVELLVQSQVRRQNSPLASITPEERQLLSEIAAGRSDAAIARSLAITKEATEVGVRSLCAKLHLPGAEDGGGRVRAALAYLAGAG